MRQWFLGITFSLNRLLLRQALLEPVLSTRARTSTAVMLLVVATGMSRLRLMVPDGQLELLPVLLPPLLYQLAELVAADPPASFRPADSS